MRPMSAARSALESTVAAVPPISLRIGREGLDVLDEIARHRGVTRAEAARLAIVETAEQNDAERVSAAEARRLAADPEYIREVREVAASMELQRLTPPTSADRT